MKIMPEIEQCEVKHCKGKATMNYYNHRICMECFVKHCNSKIDLKIEFDIKELEN